MPECDHNCDGCADANCESREIKKLQPHKFTKIGKIVAVMSGKGGVGKSLVTSLTAVALAKKGYKVAIMDADVTGPSIPKSFGLNNVLALQNNDGLLPVESHKLKIKIMSANLLLEDCESPIIWRGPLVAGFVQQLFTDVNYGEVDFLLIDMPPGTSDIPLTVFQSIPIDGVLVVSSPQDLVSMVVSKSINMAKMMYVPIFGLVENMSYVKCPNCDEKIEIFNNKHFEEDVIRNGLDILAKLPLDPKLSTYVDNGEIEDYDVSLLDNVAIKLSK